MGPNSGTDPQAMEFRDAQHCAIPAELIFGPICNSDSLVQFPL